MTLLVLLLALIHAVPIILVGYVKRTKLAVTYATIAMTIIGVIIGAAGYWFIDLIGVAIGYYLANRFFVNNNFLIRNVQHEGSSEPEPEPEVITNNSSWTALDKGLTVLVVIVILSYILKQNNVKPIHSNSTMPLEIQSIDKTNKHEKSNDNSETDLRHCLNLSSKEAIIRCTENQNK